MEEVKAKTAHRKRQAVRLFKDNNSILILIVLLLAGITMVDGFKNGFYNVLVYSAVYGVVCVGLGLIMITGNIDLSSGFQAGLAGVSTVLAFNAVYHATGNSVLSLVVGIIAALLTGAITGFINGFVVTKIGVSSLIATIAANYAYKGLVFYFAQASFAPEDAEIVKIIAKTRIADIKWLTPALIILVAVVVIVALWMYKTKFGNRLHVVGDNPEAAAFAGINVANTTWVAYIIGGVLAAVTGFMMVSWDGYAIFTQGNSLSTFTISCCVIGGIKMAGGKGTAVHVLLGVLIMRTIQTIMTCLFLTSDWVNFITGALLVVVLIVDRFTSAKDVQ